MRSIRLLTAILVLMTSCVCCLAEADTQSETQQSLQQQRSTRSAEEIGSASSGHTESGHSVEKRASSLPKLDNVQSLHSVAKRALQPSFAKRPYRYEQRKAPWFIGKRSADFDETDDVEDEEEELVKRGRSKPRFIGKRDDFLSDDGDAYFEAQKKGRAKPRFIGKRDDILSDDGESYFASQKRGRAKPRFIGKRLIDFGDDIGFSSDADSLTEVDKRRRRHRDRTPKFIGKRGRSDKPRFIGRRNANDDILAELISAFSRQAELRHMRHRIANEKRTFGPYFVGKRDLELAGADEDGVDSKLPESSPLEARSAIKDVYTILPMSAQKRSYLESPYDDDTMMAGDSSIQLTRDSQQEFPRKQQWKRFNEFLGKRSVDDSISEIKSNSASLGQRSPSSSGGDVLVSEVGEGSFDEPGKVSGNVVVRILGDAVPMEKSSDESKRQYEWVGKRVYTDGNGSDEEAHNNEDNEQDKRYERQYDWVGKRVYTDGNGSDEEAHNNEDNEQDKRYERQYEWIGKRVYTDGNGSDKEAHNNEDNEQDKRYERQYEWVGKRVYTDGNGSDEEAHNNEDNEQDKRYEFLGKRNYDFLGKRSYDFLGKRGYDFLGKRGPYYHSSNDILAKRDYDFLGKRNYDFLGKRGYDFLGKRNYDFLGKRGYDFLGKRDYDFLGKRGYDFLGKRDYDFLGKRGYDFLGKRDYDFLGKRNYDFLGKRNYDFLGKRGYDFFGKRNYDFLGKRSFANDDKRNYDFLGKRGHNLLDAAIVSGAEASSNSPNAKERTAGLGKGSHKTQILFSPPSDVHRVQRRYSEWVGKKKRSVQHSSDRARLAFLLRNNTLRKRLSRMLLGSHATSVRGPEFIGK